MNTPKSYDTPIVIHSPGGASGIQFFLQEGHELTKLCPVDENMKPYEFLFTGKYTSAITMISIVKEGVQKLVSPSDYVMGKYEK